MSVLKFETARMNGITKRECYEQGCHKQESSRHSGKRCGATLWDGEIFHFHNMSQFHGNTCQSRANVLKNIPLTPLDECLHMFNIP